MDKQPIRELLINEFNEANTPQYYQWKQRLPVILAEDPSLLSIDLIGALTVLIFLWPESFLTISIKFCCNIWPGSSARMTEKAILFGKKAILHRLNRGFLNGLIYALFLGFFTCYAAQFEQINKPHTTVHQTVVQTIVNQNMHIETSPQDMFGQELNNHLNNLDNKTFKHFFSKLPTRAKIMYMLSITPDQYERFLERYTDQEWTKFWIASSDEDKKHLPKTRQEQLALLRDAYYAYIERQSSPFYSYFNPKAPYPSDLAALKQAFYKDNAIASQKGDMTSFSRNAKLEFLKAYMHRKRIELLNL